MDRHDYRRLVSWIAHYVNKGWTWEDILAQNATNKVHHKVEDLEACKAVGFQACQNADTLSAEIERRKEARAAAAKLGEPPPVFPPMRLCDLKGCKFDTGEET